MLAHGVILTALAASPQLSVTGAAGGQLGVSPAIEDVQTQASTADLDALASFELRDRLGRDFNYTLNYSPSVRTRLQVGDQGVLFSQNAGAQLSTSRLGDEFTTGSIGVSFSGGDVTVDQLPSALQGLVGAGQSSVIGILAGSGQLGVSRRFSPRTNGALQLSTSLQQAPVAAADVGAPADFAGLLAGEGALQLQPVATLTVNHLLTRSVVVGAALRADTVIEAGEFVFGGALLSVNRSEVAFRVLNVRIDVGGFIGGEPEAAGFSPSFSFGISTPQAVRGLLASASVGLAPTWDVFLGALSQRAGAQGAVAYNFNLEWQAALKASGFFAAFPDARARALGLGTMNFSARYQPSGVPVFTTFGISASLRDVGQIAGIATKTNLATDFNFFIRVGAAAQLGGDASQRLDPRSTSSRAPSLL